MLKKTNESRQGKENLLDSTRSDHTLAFTTEHALPVLFGVRESRDGHAIDANVRSRVIWSQKRSKVRFEKFISFLVLLARSQ